MGFARTPEKTARPFESSSGKPPPTHVRRCATLGLVIALGLTGCGDDGDAANPGGLVPTGGGSTTGGSTTGGGGNPPPDPGDDVLDFVDPGTPAPTLSPALLSLTYVGGAGDQYASSVVPDGAGGIVVSGDGWTLTYDAAALASGAPVGSLEGDVTTAGEATNQRPPLPGDPGRAYYDPRIDLTFTVGYRQSNNLQIPIFRAFEGEERVWLLWGHAAADIQAANLGADSRCYEAWGMPEGRIGVQCWTDGGNSVLARDPRDLGQGPSWTDGSWQQGAGGMASLFALVDPANGGSVESGTFMAAHVGHTTRDAWGRVYVGRVASSRDDGDEPTDTFGLGASGGAGLMVLDPDLRQPLLNTRIGGTCEGGEQFFSDFAFAVGVLVMGGTTCAADLATVNAAQAAPGGGQDAMVAVIRLW